MVTEALEQFDEAEPQNLKSNFIREDGTARIRIIKPGKGSSGYYPEAMLARDAAKVYQPGTHMYLDHPTLKEEKDRPERSLKDMAGVITGNVSFQKTPMPGVYADCQVFKNYRPFLREMAPYIGISHRALGKSKAGTVDGYTGTIIESLDKCLSVDFVTVPGAGGGLVQMWESWRNTESTENMNSTRLSEALHLIDQIVMLQEGCKISLEDVFGAGKKWEDLSSTQQAHFKSLFAYVDGDDPEHCHLPYRDPKTGAVLPNCVKAALAAIAGARQGTLMDLGDKKAEVVKKLQDLLPDENKDKKESGDMELGKLDLRVLKENRPDLIQEIIQEAGQTEQEKAKMQKLTEAAAMVETLKTENARLKEAQAIQEGVVFMTKALGPVKLPEITKARIVESLKSKVPMKDGKFDEAGMKTVLEETVKAESAYLAKVTEAGKVRGFGGVGGGTPEDGQKALAEAFKGLNMTEEQAKIAAAGRL
jgi:hypothetical protein